MPKIKTVRGAAKRFKKTAGGYKHRQSFTSHNFSSKSTKRKRHLRSPKLLSSSDTRLVNVMLAS